MKAILNKVTATDLFIIAAVALIIFTGVNAIAAVA